jgi:hypothetical protein
MLAKIAAFQTGKSQEKAGQSPSKTTDWELIKYARN